MTATSELTHDYYATLQVHPDADNEVIEAAYRQLMKKHHPDLAGDNPERIREHLDRAKALNEAHTVLGDPQRRRQYDSDRRAYGTHQPRPPARHASSQASTANPPPGTARTPPPAGAAPPNQGTVGETVIVKSPESGLPGPLGLFSAAYYLLPGPYEWEEGSRRELVAVALLPVAGVATFAILTGRLTPWIGQSLNATVLAWGLVVLLFLPMLGSLPRLAMAGGPSLLLLSGSALPVLQQVHVPIWFAWGVASLLSVMLAARLFVFAVLPTVAICWLITRVA